MKKVKKQQRLKIPFIYEHSRNAYRINTKIYTVHLTSLYTYN